MNWLQACKEWNRRKGGKYEVPKKGTAGYKEVRKLMGVKGGMDGRQTPPPVQRDPHRAPPPPPQRPRPQRPPPPPANPPPQLQPQGRRPPAGSPGRGGRRVKGRKVGAGERTKSAIANMYALKQDYGFTDDDVRAWELVFQQRLAMKPKGFFTRKHTNDQIKEAIGEAVDIINARKAFTLENSPRGSNSPQGAFDETGWASLTQREKDNRIRSRMLYEEEMKENERLWYRENQARLDPLIERDRQQLAEAYRKMDENHTTGEAGIENLNALASNARRKYLEEMEHELKNAKGKPKKGGFLPLLTAGLTALPSIISLFKGNGKQMEMSAQHLVDDMVGAGLIGGTHKSQYVKWLLGRVRGNREGEVKKPDADDWGDKDDVYRRPYPKDTKRRPDARAPPQDTEYAGWRPEDWDGRHPPFKAESVKTRSKFIQALLPTEKKSAPSAPPAEDKGDKKKYKLNPSLRKFPGITSKQMIDFRTRVGSKRSQNTFGELTNMGQFFGDEDFLNKYDTAEKLEPFVKEWEKVKGTRKPKEWYAENASFVVETDVPSVVIKRKAKSAEKPAEAPKSGKDKHKEAMLALKTARDALPNRRAKATLTQRVRYYELKGLPYEDAIYKALETGKKK